jgi:hypothetical protein
VCFAGCGATRGPPGGGGVPGDGGLCAAALEDAARTMAAASPSAARRLRVEDSACRMGVVDVMPHRLVTRVRRAQPPKGWS